MEENNKKYPEGHFIGMWMGIGIAIFSGIGIPLSIVSENYGFIGIGPAIGIAFGLAVGSSIEARYQKEGKIRPLSEEEKKRKKMGITAGIVILSLGALIFLILALT
jgi:hypothetical protein